MVQYIQVAYYIQVFFTKVAFFYLFSPKIPAYIMELFDLAPKFKKIFAYDRAQVVPVPAHRTFAISARKISTLHQFYYYPYCWWLLIFDWNRHNNDFLITLITIMIALLFFVLLHRKKMKLKMLQFIKRKHKVQTFTKKWWAPFCTYKQELSLPCHFQTSSKKSNQNSYTCRLAGVFYFTTIQAFIHGKFDFWDSVSEYI